MVRARTVVHLVRDAFVTMFSVVLVSTTWGRWAEEPVFLVLDGLGVAFIVLSAVDVALILAKVRRRGFFVANAAYQLIPSFIVAGLLPYAGIPMVLLNVLALVTLREKRTPEELLAHPYPPRGRNYKLVVSMGVLVMAGAVFLPWASAPAGTTASLFAIYTAIAFHSGLPDLTVSPQGAVFALLALVLFPAAVVLGALGLRWRRMSGVAGVLGTFAGLGMALALSGAVGYGAYVALGGGVVVLLGFAVFRRA